MHFDREICHLIDLFPDLDPETALNAILQSDGNIEESIDWVLAHREENDDLAQNFPMIEKETLKCFIAAHVEGNDIFDEIIFALQDKQSTKIKRKYTKLDIFHPHSRKPHIVYNRCSIAKITDIDIKNVFFDHIQYDSSISVDDRQEITFLYQKKSELLKRACKSHSDGGLTGTGSAAFYSEEARKIQKRISIMEAHYAYDTFCSLNEGFPIGSLDLHGLFVEQAIKIVDLYLTKNFASSNPTTIEIITGSGKHSSGKPRLRPAIWRYLIDDQLNFYFDGTASFKVTGRK